MLKEKPNAIINILDVTSIDRSMYLTMHLLEMGIPMVVAFNMMDEMTGNGGSVDCSHQKRAGQRMGPIRGTVSVRNSLGSRIDSTSDRPCYGTWVAKWENTVEERTKIK